MNYLDQKINEHFAGLVVRKDLVKTVKGNAIVPTYVLEYLLGQYCATSDEASIQSGIETVREILRKHFVHRNEANLVKSIIREQGRHRVIDKISVALNEKTDAYEAVFSNLGIKEVLIDADTVKRHPKLLVSGVWCIADLEYRYSEDSRIVPWILESLKPIQLSHFDLELYLKERKEFTTAEWLDLLVQSMGFNPEMFDQRAKLLQIMRLLPYCERNYNLIELGPKGTGKSHIYSEFSPHGILISGGEVTVPKLFVNNTTGRIGLVGYWDVVAFDEFAGKSKRVDRALVDILKNYLANKSFSRGVETLGAEASMAFVGNTQHNLQHMLMHSNLFDELPDKYYDSAFLDRIHFYIPGWEVEIIRGEMFSNGYGFVVDYLAEVLRTFRNYDFSHRYERFFELSSDISTRDRDGIHKTFSGLMKILFPEGDASQEDIELLLRFSIEGRKRVKDQLLRIDPTYARVKFSYSPVGEDQIFLVKTLEETLYPQHYYKTAQDSSSGKQAEIEFPDLGQTEEKAQLALTVEQLIQQGESKRLEFKSTLRYCIQTQKDEVYIEQAVIRTVAAFLNSEGGTLLVGVDDSGEILGIDLDHFPNEDKYLLHFANLVNNKFGKQFVDYIQWDFQEIQGRKVLRVDCRRSPTPVFLKLGDRDELYIRSGPSTVPLSAKEVLEYSKSHF
ncbi:MAG: BREX system Lon protease-like protein BrxL [Anaerolineales bacterium]|jgi:ATP-dependent Lon protease|nr:BREX system Lon protease-like protein BrxL [Anaerolineales bacterium]